MTDTPSENVEQAEPEPGDGPEVERSRTPTLAILAVVAVVAAVALWAVVFRSGGSGDDLDQLDATRFNTLTFTREDGSEGTLADFEGQPLVVNFFASWCAPCRAEMPDIQSTFEQAQGKVAFVGVNADVTEDAWRSFVAESNVSYPTVFQPDNEIFSELGLIGMPSTVLIKPDGTLAKLHSGIIDADELKKLIAENLEVSL